MLLVSVLYKLFRHFMKKEMKNLDIYVDNSEMIKPSQLEKCISSQICSK